MPFNRPTLQQLISRDQTDIESRLPGTDPRLRYSVLGILARTHSGAVHGLYGHQEWISRQIIPSTADEVALKRAADFWGLSRLPASPASGVFKVNGTNGSTLPAGTLLQRSDGVQYSVDADGTVASGSVSVTITAVTAGADTNASGGRALTLVSPVDGIQSSGAVDSSGLSGGADIESLQALLTRLEKRVRTTPQGGNATDWEQWTLQVSGNTRVWVEDLWIGAGSVGIFFMRDGQANPFPTQTDIDTTYNSLLPKKPAGIVGADGLVVLAPTAHAVDIAIQLNPNTSAVQTAVSSALTDLFRTEANVENGSGSGVVLLSHIEEAISGAAGEVDHKINLVADVAPAKGELATLGQLTFSAL